MKSLLDKFTGKPTLAFTLIFTNFKSEQNYRMKFIEIDEANGGFPFTDENACLFDRSQSDPNHLREWLNSRISYAQFDEDSTSEEIPGESPIVLVPEWKQWKQWF